MRNKSKNDSDSERQYRFETTLPMDEAMQRLHDQMGHIRDGLFRLRRYKISSGKRRDSIYFEIVRSATRISHKLVITGTIREISPNRTVLECQVKGNNPVRHTALWALPLFLTLMLTTTYYGGFPLPVVILLSLVATGLLLFVFAPARFPELGADDIEHIEKAIGCRESANKVTGESAQKPMPE